MPKIRAKIQNYCESVLLHTCLLIVGWLSFHKLKDIHSYSCTHRFFYQVYPRERIVAFFFSYKIRICFFSLLQKDIERKGENEGVSACRWIRFRTFIPNKFEVEIWNFLSFIIPFLKIEKGCIVQVNRLCSRAQRQISLRQTKSDPHHFCYICSTIVRHEQCE